MSTKSLGGIILFLSVITLLGTIGCAQRQGQVQGAATATPEGPKMTIKGKIEFMTNLGGYFVHGEEPGGEFFIMNENPQVLEGLLKSGKTLVIEGRIVKGAEFLYIEKIDGQPYQGAKIQK